LVERLLQGRDQLQTRRLVVLAFKVHQQLS